MKVRASCLISAGEFSGDLLARDLVCSLKDIQPNLDFYGIAGREMLQAGVKSVATIEELSVMGLSDVIKSIGRIKLIEDRILTYIDRHPPDFAVLVDFPGFHLRLASLLKLRGIPVIQYVAPKLWAWGEQRMLQMKRDVDVVLGIFPFEATYFGQHNVPFVYVGTPLLDRVKEIRPNRKAFFVKDDEILVGMLPGSRLGEIARILPELGKVRQSLLAKAKNMKVVVPVSSNLQMDQVLNHLPGVAQQLGQGIWLKDHIYFVQGQSLSLMASCDVALVTSGTATLECALLGTPMAVIYVTNQLTYRMAQWKLKLPWISLVNILQGKEVVKEFVQCFDPSVIADLIVDLAGDSKQRDVMKGEFLALKHSLNGDASEHAAQYISQHFLEDNVYQPIVKK
jgi:lipid-A-disaccharide synthase